MLAPLPRLPGALAAPLLVALLGLPVWGQLGAYPGQTHFAALDELASADYSRAERVFRSELRTAVQTVDSRWLDSVCFAAGLGESLYQQGRYPEALEQFDAALDLFLDQANWMRSVQWQQEPRENTSLGRRLPAWATGGRGAAFADVPRSFLYQFGRVDNSAAAQQGGVVQVAQFWKLDAQELARSIAWSLYRRGDLLGPLGAYDARNRAVTTRLAAGGLGPTRHWTGAWTELWWGLALGASGDAAGALPRLEQATLLVGRMEHPLGALALVARGRLIAAAGDGAAGGALLEHAVTVATAYDDYAVLAEGVRALHELRLADPKAPDPPVGAIAATAERSGLWQVAIEARLAEAERALLAGETPRARELLAVMFRRAREAARGPRGREAERLAALAATGQGLDAALTEARRAVADQQPQSRRLFQVRLACRWFDEGQLSTRLARQALGALLADPGAFVWRTDPLDGLASLGVPESDAFDRWFAAAVDRRDPLEALRVIDQQRRREVFAGHALGGRLLGARWLLEGPEGRLTKSALEARAGVEATVPEYREARRAGFAAREALVAALAADTENASPATRRAAADLEETIAMRERLALRVALSRTPTPMPFPPPLDPVAAKSVLEPGDALLVFHEAGEELHGVVLTTAGEHLWRVGATADVAALIERLLRESFGASARQRWEPLELAAEKWRGPAGELSERLLGESRLDPATLDRLWVVPAGPLWRAPLALLAIPGAKDGATLEAVELHVAPTPGWAVRPRPEPNNRPGAPGVAWLVGAESGVAGEGADALRTAARLSAPPPGLAPTTSIVKSATDRLVADAGGASLADDPLGLALTTAGRGAREVGAWSRLPIGGAPAVVLRNLGGYEPGGGKPRRSGGARPVGAPELHAVAALLAGGAETVLLERWSTGGARADELVADWVKGVVKLPPAEAWRRSLDLGRPEPLEPSREPRLTPDPEMPPPTAEHPFWWSGYVLID